MKCKLMCLMLSGMLLLTAFGCSNIDLVEQGTPLDVVGPNISTDDRESSTGKIPVEDKGDVTESIASSPIVTTDVNPFWFEDTLRDFLVSNSEWCNSSYMVSPTSFRAALCLAIEGASGETKESLMHAAGFRNDEELKCWYDELLIRQSKFLKQYESMKSFGDDPKMGFDIANGIWDNASIPGEFQQSYIDAVTAKYKATVGSSIANDITEDVNSWCAEKTNNMIQSISPDLSDVSSVLVNALYVKSAWRETFSEYMTDVGQFTKSDGSVCDLEFMQQTEDFLYYCDRSDREYAAFGLEGDLWFTVCLDTDVRVQDMLYAMYNASYNKLQVRMPKLDMETTLSNGELLSFLEQQGAGVALSDFADFSKMTDLPEGWHIGDIIQKTRIKTDEDGFEAAAVTAFMMADNMAIIEPVTPIPFYMDKPFSFMITSGLNTSNSSAVVLFLGQYFG